MARVRVRAKVSIRSKVRILLRLELGLVLVIGLWFSLRSVFLVYMNEVRLRVRG